MELLRIFEADPEKHRCELPVLIRGINLTVSWRPSLLIKPIVRAGFTLFLMFVLLGPTFHGILFYFIVFILFVLSFVVFNSLYFYFTIYLVFSCNCIYLLALSFMFVNLSNPLRVTVILGYINTLSFDVTHTTCFN